MFDDRGPFDQWQGNDGELTPLLIAGDVVSGLVKIIAAIIVFAVLVYWLSPDAPPKPTAAEIAACKFHALSCSLP